MSIERAAASERAMEAARSHLLDECVRCNQPVTVLEEADIVACALALDAFALSTRGAVAWKVVDRHGKIAGTHERPYFEYEQLANEVRDGLNQLDNERYVPYTVVPLFAAPPAGERERSIAQLAAAGALIGAMATGRDPRLLTTKEREAIVENATNTVLGKPAIRAASPVERDGEGR